MSSVPEKNAFLAQENGVVVDQHDDEMKSVVKSDSDNSLSSSIGKLSNGVIGGDEEAGEEAVSKNELDEGALNSLTALEAALPFKRGLSGFYTGKSKSFVNLLEVKSLQEMEKEESPMNKRRRLTTTQNAMYKRASSSSSMPVLTRIDGENAQNVGVEQEFKSSTGNTSFSSVNSATKPSIN
ncbi:protein OXIDATIVE STRESS 3 LIKE 4-like [Lycium barbarum]|uniref:protein OXIDATIVE STRESS 3 LIKE 4-like n=1 Tax=Lycium barbarum TaxID=112863 RepID=UPI00293F0E63|nr:protein OXIDATIVE STRESS 3 LIKE 4-like [Lycium barbarum]